MKWHFCFAVVSVLWGYIGMKIYGKSCSSVQCLWSYPEHALLEVWMKDSEMVGD